MSEENVELLRQVWARQDQDAFLGILAEDIVWDLSRSSFPEAGIYRGHAGVRKWFSGLDVAWEDLGFEIEEITDLGQDRVLIVTRTRGHGQFSKIAVDYLFATVWTFLNRRVVRMDRYDNRSEALEASGLAE